MARIPGVAGRAAGPSTKIAYWFTRRALRRLTGRSPENMIEPVRLYAHSPAVLRGCGQLERAAGKLRSLDRRAMLLAELTAATEVRCEFCVDLGRRIAQRWGLTDDELRALPDYRASELFSERDRLVLDYATGMTRTPAEVPAELVAALRGHFTDTQLVELTFLVALGNFRGRFNHALGVGAAGFSDRSRTG